MRSCAPAGDRAVASVFRNADITYLVAIVGVAHRALHVAVPSFEKEFQRAGIDRGRSAEIAAHRGVPKVGA